MSDANFSMIGLLRMEVEQHGGQLKNLLNTAPFDAEIIDDAERAAQALKGAAKLVNINSIYTLSDKLLSLFSHAKKTSLPLSEEHCQLLLSVVVKIQYISSLNDNDIQSFDENEDDFQHLQQQLEAVDLGVNVDESSVDTHYVESSKMEIDNVMLEMFKEEVDSHSLVIADCLLILENDASDDGVLEKLMRAAHSIKGAARMVGVDVIVQIAHVMEDVFVASQNKQLTLDATSIDVLLASNDLIIDIASQSGELIGHWQGHNQKFLDENINKLNLVLRGEINLSPATDDISSIPKVIPNVEKIQDNNRLNSPSEPSADEAVVSNKVLKVTADRWDSMMGLAGEIKVEASWLVPYLNNMMKMHKKQHEMSKLVGGIIDYIGPDTEDKELLGKVSSVHHKLAEFRNIISDQMNDLDQYERRISNLTERLHREALSTRMRPFADGVQGFPRMVRDISRSLKKNVRLELKGELTQVDRDVLEKMESPLNHIVRNALDHGIEAPDIRLASGKPEQANIILTACHNEGMLLITVEDNGCGIDIEMLRERIVKKNLVNKQIAKELSAEELLEFLFLPGFSTREYITDLSGRGVGLDVAKDTIHAMRGHVKVETVLGEGSKFSMRLPLALSVVSGLLVKVSDEYYAFPLSRIVCTAKVSLNEIEIVEGHQYVTINDKNIGLITANRVFELNNHSEIKGDQLSVIVITNHDHTYGVVVDEFVDQREFAVQTIDQRLEKIQDVSNYSLLEDGSTVLIVDVDDMVQTIDTMVKGGRIINFVIDSSSNEIKSSKCILVVDDSLTVREVEKKLLEDEGYDVDVAVDGMDGWNAVRAKQYDLIISDIDMPRMNGIELVEMIKNNNQLNTIPVIIISYKDRADDRKRGMDIGADYYLTKGSFHDDSFLHAVHDLIGEAVE